MLICQNCEELYQQSSLICPRCDYSPARVSGFPAFASELAFENDFFSTTIYQCLAEIEPSHFWFENRNKILQSVIKKHFHKAQSLCEIGCGNGTVLSSIAAAFPDITLSGCDIYLSALKSAKSKVPAVKFYQADICRFPFQDEFDIVGALDILEHIENDQLALNNIFNSIRAGGGAIITIPQHSWLWTKKDELELHKRRYNRTDIEGKIKKAGFRIIRMTSLNALVLPLLITSRMRLKLQPKKNEAYYFNEFKIAQWLNFLLRKICDFERILFKHGLNFPAGGSLLCILSKD